MKYFAPTQHCFVMFYWSSCRIIECFRKICWNISISAWKSQSKSVALGWVNCLTFYLTSSSQTFPSLLFALSARLIIYIEKMFVTNAIKKYALLPTVTKRTGPSDFLIIFSLLLLDQWKFTGVNFSICNNFSWSWNKFPWKVIEIWPW